MRPAATVTFACLLTCVASAAEPKDYPTGNQAFDKLVDDAYHFALKDSQVRTPERKHKLLALSEGNKDLIWSSPLPPHRVLMAGVFDGTFDPNTKKATRDYWVTAASELRHFYQAHQEEFGRPALRLKQLLGLDPAKKYTQVVEFWADTKDIFRPSPDPEIDDSAADLDFDPQDKSPEAIAHKKWCEKTQDEVKDKWPWTRLGYTYDWGNLHGHVGLSEFVVRKDAPVEVFKSYAINTYFADVTLPPARVAAWNVASGRGKTGGTPIPKDRIQRIGKAIAERIKPDVIVLEEVWEAGAAEEIARASTNAGYPLEALDVPAQPPGVVQLVAVLKRPQVELRDLQVIAGSEDLLEGDHPEEKASRQAIFAFVKIGNFDFFLVGVHLKSKMWVKDVKKSPVEMRDRQCKVISNRIKEVTTQKEKDVLVIGDYNMTPDAELPAGAKSDQANFDTLSTGGMLRFLSSEVKGETHLSEYKGKVDRSKFDGFAIAKDTEAEYVPGSFRILDFHALGAEESQFTQKNAANFLSDHYPIVAEFRVDQNDDD